MTSHWIDHVSPAQLDQLVEGAHRGPHDILGAHSDAGGVVVRTLRPYATRVVALSDQGRVELTKIHPHGVFSGRWGGGHADYRLEVWYGDSAQVTDDPYRWLPTLGEVDQHLIREGRHEQLWQVLGAHERAYHTPTGTVTGVSFAVWAPNARGVRVAGDFNHWDGQAFPMRSIGATGVWELFIPGLVSGARYKYQILGVDNIWREKADPMAFATEEPPRTASVVFTSQYEWRDEAWLARRAATQWHQAPISAYELHIGSWRQGLNYRELAHELTPYLIETGFTHVELLPITEHPFGGSWGYQVSSYYAPTARYGNPDDFRYFVDHLHQAGIGVLMDWVPAHFPKDEWALAQFDGTPLYEHSDPRMAEHPDWGTLIFNYGRHEVRNFLVANALYWLEEFHLDGLRVDAVASMLYLDYSRKDGEWTPNKFGGRENLDAVQFLQEMNATVYKRMPGVITSAEESTSWSGVTRATDSGGLGFGFKWNMGWMHDTLDYLRHEPIFRQYHHNELTFSLVYAYSENFILPLSHDEVVHGKGSLFRKMPGDRWQQFATLRALFGYMWAHPGKQLLFMGGEFAQDAEWAHDKSLDWHLLDQPENSGIRRLVCDLNRIYKETKALWTKDYDPSGFAWINPNDASGNVLSFARYGHEDPHEPDALVCVVNFAGIPHEEYRIGLPRPGAWIEIVNTDATEYGGSGVGNYGAITALDEPYDGLPFSGRLRLPPLGALLLRHGG